MRGDAGQVQQILINLVVNARDAMPSGGSLRIETFNHTRNFRRADSPAAPQPCVQLSIIDTGTGMKPEIVERIFEPFLPRNRASGAPVWALPRSTASSSR